MGLQICQGRLKISPKSNKCSQTFAERFKLCQRAKKSPNLVTLVARQTR